MQFERPSFRRGFSSCVTETELESHIKGTARLKYFDKQVLSYDAEGMTGPSVFALLCTSASVLRRARLLRDLFITLSIAGLLSPLLRYLLKEPPTPEELTNVVTLINTFHTLLTWLLGFFVSTALSRWWTVRSEGIGNLWGSVSDLTMLVSSFYPQDTSAHKEVRDRVLRWGVLSHELLYKQVSGSEDLRDLIEAGLLLPEEHQALGGVPSKPQVVWTWMSGFFTHLAVGSGALGSTLPFPGTTLWQLHNLCRQGRGAIGGALALADTQIPFAYAHLLGALVWVHNVVQALASAFVFWESSSRGDYYRFGAEAVYLVVYPTVMLSLLHIGVGMMNPMRSREGMDFPRGAYSCFMVAENRAFQQAQVRPPYKSDRLLSHPSAAF